MRLLLSVLPFVLWVLSGVVAASPAPFPSTTSATFQPKRSEGGGKSGFDFETHRYLWFDFAEGVGRSEDDVPLQPTLPFGNSTGTVCVNGSWLGYKKANLVATSIGDVSLISGVDSCVDLKKLGLNSMQPVSPFLFRPDSLATFADRLFGSPATVSVPLERTLLKIRREPLPKMSSFILSGSSALTLVDTLGRIYCVTPKGKGGICLVPDVAQFGLSPKVPFTGVIKGCEKGKAAYTRTIELTNCKDFATTSVLTKPTSKRGDLGGNGVRGNGLRGNGVGGRNGLGGNGFDGAEDGEECPGMPGVVREDPPDFSVLKELLSIRVSHDFLSPWQLLWPGKGELVWRTNVSDGVFEVAGEICPPELLSPLFLSMLREFFVFHLNEVWKKEDPPPGVPEAQSVALKLAECILTARRYAPSMRSGMLQAWRSLKKEEDKGRLMHPNLTMDATNDPVIEASWVAFNLAYGLCHHFQESRADFFADFLRTVSHTYFTPLVHRWLKPSIPPSTFRYLLGGFGFKEQYENLQLCASTVLRLTRNFEPFSRVF